MDFLTYVGANYDSIVANCKKNLRMYGIGFDYDLFTDTLLKCQEKLKDHNQDEYERYLWVALKNNALRTLDDVSVTLDENADVEEVGYDDFADKVESCIKKEFGQDWYNLYMEHANGKRYEDFDDKFGNVKYKFRRIREFVRGKFIC